MRDERDEDALFDRLARSLEALRRDAELVRSAMADPAIGESIARADAGLRSMATNLEAHTEALAAHRQSVESRITQTARLQDEIAELRSSVSVLSRRVEAQMAAPASPAPRRYVIILAACFAVLALALVAGGAVLYWRGSLPAVRTLGQSLAARVATVAPAKQESTAIASEPPPAESTPPAPQAPHAADTVAPAAPATPLASPAAPPAAAAATEGAAAPPPVPPASPVVGAAPVAPPTPGPAPAPAPVAAPAKVAALSASAPAPSPPPQVTLRAIDNAWVEIRQRSGHVLLRRTMRQGERWIIPPDPDLLLSTGYAGGLVFDVKGASVPLNGGKPAVLHDVPIDPDLIAAGVVARTAP